MCVCEETGKFRKNSYFSDLCCTAFTMIVYFSYNASIHFKPIFRLWKNWFLRKWNTGFKWLKLIPRENHCNRSWLCLFFINRQEEVEIKLSNTFFPFFSILTSALLIIWAAFYTYLKFEETIFEFVQMLLQAFSDTINWIYKKTHTSIPNGLKISPVSSIIRLRLNMLHLHRVSTKNELFNWILSHVIRNWLVGTSTVIRSSCR